MKTIREIINTHSIEKNEDILQDMVDELYTYVEYRENLKVIEEVNEFKLWLYKNYPDKFIDIDITLLYKLFKKLKQ